MPIDDPSVINWVGPVVGRKHGPTSPAEVNEQVLQATVVVSARVADKKVLDGPSSAQIGQPMD